MQTLLACTNLKRLLIAGYLLLWPPFFILLTRKSHQADVLGWWSFRVIGLLLAILAVLAGLSLLVWRWTRSGGSVPIWPARVLASVRRSYLLTVLAALLPVLAWLGVIGYAGILRLEPSTKLLLSLADLALLVLAWEAALIFSELPRPTQRLRLMKLILASSAVIVSMAAVEITAALLHLSPYANWEINPKNLDVRFQTDDFDVKVVTNDQGLREPRTIAAAHPGVFRVIVVGDSMTFGWGAEYEESYPFVVQSVLQEKYGLKNIEVINLGKPGSTPVDYLRFIRRYAARVNPDLIVVGFLIGNDCPVFSPASLLSEEQVHELLARYEKQTRPGTMEKILWKSYLARTFYTGVYRRLAFFKRVQTVGKRGPLFNEPNPLDPSPLEAEIAQTNDPGASRLRFDNLKKQGWIQKGLDWRINPWLVKAAIVHPAGAADTLAVREETQSIMRHEWKLCEGLLSEMKATSAECGAEFVVLAIPNAHLVSTRWLDFLSKMGCEVSDEMTDSSIVNDWMQDFCRNNEIALVDPLEIF